MAREKTPENAANNVKKYVLDTVRYDAQTFAHLQTDYAMYTSTFIFATRQLDERFYRLDETIATAAKAIPGYLGEEAWEEEALHVVPSMKQSFIADYVVLGGGNAKRIDKLPKGVELGHNRNAFTGGVRLWQNEPRSGRPRWNII